MPARSPASEKPIALINTRSLSGALPIEELEKKFRDHGIELDACLGFSDAKQLFTRLNAEASPGRLAIVGGGDGTLSAAADIVLKRNATLGVLPMGTGNAFARDLGIPTDIDEAINILTSGKVAQIDVGVCAGKHFLNVVTVGLTATVAESLTVPLKRRFGRFVYGIALVRALRNMRPFHIQLETENGKRELDAVQLVIGNGHYHGGPLPLSPDAKITSGVLHLYVVEAGSLANLLKYALLLPTGLQGVLTTVHSEDTKWGKVTTSPLRKVVVDGEITSGTPIEFSIQPAALKTCVPLNFGG